MKGSLGGLAPHARPSVVIEEAPRSQSLRKTRSCSRALSSSRCPTPCSECSSRTGTRYWPTSRGRCACTTSASCPAIACRWSSLPTTSAGVGSPTGTSNEGTTERQEDVREVQGDPSPRPGDGDLQQSASQAEAGVANGSNLRGRHPAREAP